MLKQIFKYAVAKTIYYIRNFYFSINIVQYYYT